MGRTLLVTGVSRDLGGRFARDVAADPDVTSVVGVDVIPPRAPLDGVAFVRADIRNPVIAKVIAAEDVDTVVHLAVTSIPGRSGGRASVKETNVIGTMQLLAACQQAPNVRKLVVRSSTAVYGSSPRDPAQFREDMAPKRLPRSGFAKDSVEVEGYVRGFARRRPDVLVTMLRCADVLGPTVDTALSRYFRLPVIPTVLGFDGRLQLLHEDDALAALGHVTRNDIAGTFNVAANGSLQLSQAIRRLGKPSVALPAFAFAGPLSVEQVDFLAYGRGVDTTAMRQTMGFHPAYTTEQAFAEFAAALPPGPLSRRRIETVEAALAGMVATDEADRG